ncbi:MAG: hypothetical protein HQ500_11935 [Flavobacteriales bacterium]|nr:hypothetical protein [Flavobacteriales bacterium]
MFRPLVKYLMKRSLKELDRQPSLVKGEHIRDVAIVVGYRSDESFAHAQQYVKEWRKRGMRSVDLYVYFPNKKQLESYSPNPKDIPFLRKDFNLAGKATAPGLVQALRAEYDILIDLTRGRFFACDVVIAKIKAKWKVGESDEDRAFLLDLMIDIKQDPDVRKLMHYMDHYIINLNTSNAA